MDQSPEVLHIKNESTDSTSLCKMDILNETPINSIKKEIKNIVTSDIPIKNEPEEEEGEHCEPPVSTFYVISPKYDTKKETDEPLDKNETRDDPSDDSTEYRVHEPLIKIEPIEEEENILGKHFLDTEKHPDLHISTSNIQVNKDVPINLSEPEIKTGPSIDEKVITPDKHSLDTKNNSDSDDSKPKIQVGMLQQLLSKPLAKKSKPKNKKDIVKAPKKNGDNNEAKVKEAKYVCPICQKIFSKLCGLVRHKIMHTERPYKCEYCEKKFNQKCHLAQHVVIHTGVKPFVCETCNKGFGHRSDLNKHRWIHSEVKPFTCSECNRSFTQKPHFIQHIRIHTGARPYTCDFCEKTFSQKSHLTVHRRFHTGERPYTCNICDKSFAQISNLNQHKKIHER